MRKKIHFSSKSHTFAAVDLLLKRHIASWLLLAVFLPVLLLSSLHTHENYVWAGSDMECADCLQHSCQGHMTATATWSHDCVLCQFLTLPMLTAAVMVVAVFVVVCKGIFVRSLCGKFSGNHGVVVLRGPPSE